MFRSRGVGQYVASEVHRVMAARRTPGSSRLLIYAQGSHGKADGTYAGERADLEALGRSGAIVALCDMAQTTTQGTFGNTTAQTRLGQLRDFVRGASSPARASSEPLWLVGGSGGVATLLNFARANPADVAGVVGLLPLVDLQDLYDNRLPYGDVTRTEVDAAYGGNVAASYATHNPSAAGNVEALAAGGVPVKLYYSTDDPYIAPSTVLAFRDRLVGAGGVCELQSLGAVGHTDLGVGYEGVQTDDVVDFLLAHA